jgi:predicted DNA-binding transcriptional regulator YafY
MGQRSQSETVAAILKAFLDQRTWKQADLARRVGVQAATIKKQLEELRASGVPLESEKDHPHVFWSAPKSWYPGGVLFSGEQIAELFRQLSRLPKGKVRDQLIDTVRKFVPAHEAPGAVVSPEVTAREEQFLPIIEDAATQKVALRFRYYSASRGSEDTRHASVHRVTPGPRASFLATCHRTGELKSFRVENVSEATTTAGSAPSHGGCACSSVHRRARCQSGQRGSHRASVRVMASRVVANESAKCRSGRDAD